MRWFSPRAAIVRLVVLLAMAAVLGAVAVAVPAIRQASAAGEETNQFTITSFAAVYALHRAGDGTTRMTVTETIVADFPQPQTNHGILRSIPTSYRGRDLDPELTSVTDARGTAYEVDEDESNGHLIWKIGDASTYVAGPTTYVITYEVRNAVQTFGDHQELYWDVNGDEWLQRIDQVSLRVDVDAALAGSLTGQLACYLPDRGRCPIRADGAVVTAQTGALPRGRTMTVAIGFAPQTVVDRGGVGLDAVDLRPTGLGLGGGVLALVLVWLLLAARRARTLGDPLVAESTPPVDLSPAAAACLLGRPERAVTAELLNQAVLGSVVLYGEGRRIRAKQVAPPVKPPEGDPGNLAKAALRTAFGMSKISTGDEVRDVQAEVRRTKAEVMVHAYRRYRENAALGGWVSSRNAAGLLSWPVFAAAGVLAVIMVPRAAIPVTLVSVGALLVAAAVIRGLTTVPRLSAQGRDQVRHLRGMQMFIRTADTHRLATMQSVATAERGGADDEIALYERLLGWAVVLGVEDSWYRVIGSAVTDGSRRFAWLDGDEAVLFGAPGQRHTTLSQPITAWQFAGYQTSASLASGWDSTRSAISSATSSDSSGGGGGWSSGSSGGAGGGGFSGGGGGGGGGGGW